MCVHGLLSLRIMIISINHDNIICMIIIISIIIHIYIYICMYSSAYLFVWGPSLDISRAPEQDATRSSEPSLRRRQYDNKNYNNNDGWNNNGNYENNKTTNDKQAEPPPAWGLPDIIVSLLSVVLLFLVVVVVEVVVVVVVVAAAVVVVVAARGAKCFDGFQAGSGQKGSGRFSSVELWKPCEQTGRLHKSEDVLLEDDVDPFCVIWQLPDGLGQTGSSQKRRNSPSPLGGMLMTRIYTTRIVGEPGQLQNRQFGACLHTGILNP